MLRGSAINRYSILWNHNSWIKYGSWLAAPRNSILFNTDNAIFVRQTSDKIIAVISPELHFVARNNLHIVFVNEMCPKFLLGLMNSKLMDFAYNFINPEKGEALAEVKKHHVEMLPITKSEKNNEFEPIIGSLVDQLLQLNKDKQMVSLQTKLDQIQSKIDYCEDKINKIVYELYGLTDEEIKIVEGE